MESYHAQLEPVLIEAFVAAMLAIMCILVLVVALIHCQCACHAEHEDDDDDFETVVVHVCIYKRQDDYGTFICSACEFMV
jgi:hypothetical protein